MQPCPNCGSTEINAAGYCVHCGTFRGQQGYDPGFQASAPPYGGGQASGPPYGGQPQYQQPQYQQPYQAQQPYGGYQDPNFAPGYAPPAEPPHRRPSKVPLIVLSVVAVILVVGIVGVVLVRASDSGGSGNGDNGNGDNIAAGIDKCVVGKWRVTSAKEKVDDDSGGEAEFSATGGTAEFNGDGTGKLDYGSGVVYRGTLDSNPVTITLKGNITFDYTTANNTITYSNVKADGSAELKIDGETTTSIPLDTDAKPAKYTCNGKSMTLGSTSEQSITELRKS
jgi:hypothetical protein